MAKSSTARQGRGPAPAQSTDASSGTKASDGNRPVHTIRYRGCEAAIWKNPSDKGDSYTVTLRKSWRDDKGEWHDSPTFLADDLPMLAKAVSDAHSWIAWTERRKEPGNGGER
jgi:hypothetical protein